MSRIHRLYHIDCLRSPDLTDHDPVRAHPQARPDQFPDADGPAALHICVSGLHLNKVGHMPDLKLRIVLYGDHPLPGINTVG